MRTKIRVALAFVIAVILFVLFYRFTQQYNFAVLEPQGTIASEERRLIFATVLLSLVIVLPVFALTIYIAWTYRQGNTKAKYSPHWDHNSKLEFAWWAVPIVIITVLATITWQYTHALDPYRPLVSNKKPLTVQVIALQWQWLFIYPDQKIASTNLMEIPVGRPINLQITSDAPMNSIWIPQLSGQIYAMSGMTTKLHINANHPGVYKGSSANLSGEGFANMKFNVVAVKDSDFNKWVKTASSSKSTLDFNKYTALAKPSLDTKFTLYSKVEPGLYDQVIMKYMSPASSDQGHSVEGMNHAR